jgi:hypothetical protein
LLLQLRAPLLLQLRLLLLWHGHRHAAREAVGVGTQEARLELLLVLLLLLLLLALWRQSLVVAWALKGRHGKFKVSFLLSEARGLARLGTFLKGGGGAAGAPKRVDGTGAKP